MALSRLLHEFAPRLKHLMPALLPSVLMLLRSKNRETIKSVLGFVKVCVFVSLCVCVRVCECLWKYMSVCVHGLGCGCAFVCVSLCVFCIHACMHD